MSLNKKHCKACEGEVQPLVDSIAEQLLQEIGAWEINRNGVHTITRTVTLKSFGEVINLVNKIAEIAEMEGHHPDLHIMFCRLVIELSTHAISGLSENDFIMAAKIDELIS